MGGQHEGTPGIHPEPSRPPHGHTQAPPLEQHRSRPAPALPNGDGRVRNARENIPRFRKADHLKIGTSPVRPPQIYGQHS